MSNLSNRIEQYLKKLLSENNGVLEIQRSEIAESFNCVPSQINYVLSTRFTVKNGYVVESRRGGGGYLKITQVPISNKQEVYQYLKKYVEPSISQQQAEIMINRLYEEGWLTERELHLLRTLINKDTLKISLPERDFLRARLIQGVFKVLLQENIGEER